MRITNKTTKQDEYCLKTRQGIAKQNQGTNLIIFLIGSNKRKLNRKQKRVTSVEKNGYNG
jgi:hypothetical protein